MRRKSIKSAYVKWGVLGCANIARKVVIPAIKATGDAKLVAVASRDGPKAKAWALEFGAERAYGDYESMLADPLIDAVYIPLPNGQHAAWTLRALAAGKHVLCEKPLAATAAEAEMIARAARGTGNIVLEAFMYRFHQRTQKIVNLVREGAIGRLLTMRGAFSYLLEDTSNVRLLTSEAGGALMDVGCYCVNFARLIAGEEPRFAFATMRFADIGHVTLETKQLTSHGNVHGVDLATTAMLEFPSGATLQFSSRMDSAFDGQWFEIVGTRGVIRVERPFNPRGFGCEGTLPFLLNGERIEVESRDQFELQIAAFDRAVLSGDRSALTPIADAVANMKVIDALFASAEAGRAVEV